MAATAAAIRPFWVTDPVSATAAPTPRTHVALMEVQEDPVLAALRRAPLAPPDVRSRLLALDAAVTSDPETWQTMAEFEAKIDAEHARREASRTKRGRPVE